MKDVAVWSRTGLCDPDRLVLTTINRERPQVWDGQNDEGGKGEEKGENRNRNKEKKTTKKLTRALNVQRKGLSEESGWR